MNRFLTITGGIFFILSSRYFPWTQLGELFPILQTTVQIVSRIVVASNILLILGVTFSLMEVFSHLKEKKTVEILNICIAVFIILGLSLNQSTLYDGVDRWVKGDLAPNYQNSKELSLGEKMKNGNLFKERSKNKDVSLLIEDLPFGFPDYLPLKKKWSNHELVALDVAEIHKKEVVNIPKNTYKKSITSDGKIKVTWREEVKPVKQRIVPIIVYKQTKLELNGQQLTKNDFDTTEIGALKLKGTQGENTLLVTYQEGKFSSIIYKITIFSWIALLLAFAVKFTLKCKKRELSSKRIHN
ncbi:hypothetical protein SAMN02745116_01994 [Pilibacter termitis]|uniref:Uncharacterized protein n=2 Tax=Pilibacter termitis TaxID=263852 RepID=A0A1T4PZP5_9ENTE|nr:hypothetical protein SAMN02745116_01994 [Pilibacter termitis]